ncbi:DUF2235 domain-containing protein [Xenorhabdus sp. Reich]|uniref:DUF2235 domain-containing protein n=1 Tax=Xenorhabdus littoralis TaxID=2582835 RepID=A0ABU4SQW9_9GAMM|nr:DUF2235 domain-containing protein [Xenorhabdus sp. Reich]MDX8001058.1 DUF2235 domain-containing protein [Xenorhabdus sp. Reich]
MSKLEPLDCLDCQKILKHWIEFQLVDEQGEPLAGIPYKLKIRGKKRLERTGTTDGNGVLRETELSPMPVTLTVAAQPLADKVTQCAARPDTGKAGNLQVRENSYYGGHAYHYIPLGGISDAYPKVTGWKEETLKASEHFKDSTLTGFTAHPLNRRYVLEIQAIESGINLIIGVFFDGTGNNVNNTDERLCAAEKNDLTPDQYDKFMCSFNQYGKPGDVSRLSYDNYYTNVHFLYKIYNDSKLDENSRQIKVYIEGVGTISGESDHVWGYMSGRGDAGVITKTDIAIQKIKIELSGLLKEVKDNIKSLRFDIIGFSRGAASSRHFANRILNKDADLLNALNECFTNRRYLAKSLYPTGKTRFLGIYDTVSAVAVANNNFNPHKSYTTGSDVKISLPPHLNIAQHVFHITAQNECRYNFSLNSVKPHWPELELPGAHADVGGGYDPVGDERLCITRPKMIPTSGIKVIPDNNLPVYKDVQKELSLLKKSLTIGPLITDENARIVTWRDESSALAMQRSGLINVVAAAVLTRTIKNDWSKVGMLVMQDAAQEAGLVFNKPDDKDSNYQLPAELQPLVEKAIAQGRAIRQGQQPEPFTPEELDLVWSKYTHFSAHWNGVKMKDNKIQGDAYPAEIIYANRPNDNWRRAIFDNNGKDISK